MQREDLSQLSTAHLVRQALDEAKLLAKAEVLHAKAELKEEIRAAKRVGIFAGVAGVLALCGLSTLFVLLAIALPLSEVAGLAVVGVALLAIAGGLAFMAYQQLPKKPMARTQGRLKQDLQVAKEQLT